MAMTQIIKEQAVWTPNIYLIDIGDPVSGGEDGIANRQATQLGNRTLFLKQQLEE